MKKNHISNILVPDADDAECAIVEAGMSMDDDVLSPGADEAWPGDGRAEEAGESG